MAAKPGEEALHGETLKYRTWVLKVLIHCEGCKKRVKKILQGIEGVYTTEVDSLQHKVTVTGNIDANTLIKKLSRSGKLVELWPEKPPAPPEKKKGNKSGKSKGGGGEINKEKKGLDQKNSSTEPLGEAGGSNEEGHFIEDNLAKEGAHSDDDECEEGPVGNTAGESGKKKKKKKKKQNKGENVNSVASHIPNNNGRGKGVEEISSIEAESASLATNSKEIINPPIQHPYPYPPPPMYYSPSTITTPPAYGLSYNTTYPVSSTSYYVGAPMMPMHAYTSSYYRLPPPPPPSDPIKHYGDDADDEYQDKKLMRH